MEKDELEERDFSIYDARNFYCEFNVFVHIIRERGKNEKSQHF
mgnify:CR=1 FL=1